MPNVSTKSNKMSNKKVLRKDLIGGEFTTIQLSILYDKRITPTAFRVLCTILSDKDNYKLTQGLIIKRFGIHKDTVKSAFENLEDCGYLRRTDKPRGHFYLISEFGNLSTESKVTQAEEQSIPTPNETSLKDKIKKNNDLFIKYSDEVSQYLELAGVYEAYEELYIKYISYDDLLDFYAFKRDFSKVLLRKKKEIFNECLEVTAKIGDRVAKKAVTEYKKWLKQQVFETNHLNFNHHQKWTYIKQQNQIFKTDLETATRDQLEETYYDGDY